MERNIKDIGNNLDYLALKVISPHKGTATILKNL